MLEFESISTHQAWRAYRRTRLPEHRRRETKSSILRCSLSFSLSLLYFAISLDNITSIVSEM